MSKRHIITTIIIAGLLSVALYALDINKKEIYVLAEDKTILERAVTSIESIVNQYQSYTPWMDEDVGEVGQIKELIGKISQYVDKLSVIDETSADIYLYTYFKHNCHKFSL